MIYAELEKKDLNPNITVNYISLFGIMIVILFATPLTILPCKDTVEELFLEPG